MVHSTAKIMNVLLTGGAGYIGSHTAHAVALAGHHPVVLDNLGAGHRHNVKWGPLVEGELGDAALVKNTLVTHKIQAVIHFAAHAYVGESMENPRKYFNNNAVASLTMLDAMQDAGVNIIVVSSTCATYGIPAMVPITEDHVQVPVNPYGESKLFVALVRVRIRFEVDRLTLFQRGRGGTGGRAMRGARSRDAFDPVSNPGGAGNSFVDRHLRIGLSHA